MVRRHSDIYIYLLLFFLCFYILNYVLILMGLINTRHSVVFDAVVYVIFFVVYIWRYRRGNLLCFELMAVPIGFVGLFFLDIILQFVPEMTLFYNVGDEIVKEKSATLQMIAWLVFLLGSVIAHNKYKNSTRQEPAKVIINHRTLVYFLTGLVFLLIIYDYYSGVFESWFFYSNMDVIDRDERNEGLGHLTCFILAGSIADIIRLRDAGVSSFWGCLKKCNKLLIAEWLFISTLLFITGNRNEMLLVLLPLIISYSICIHKISNKFLLVAGVIGVILMVLSGSSRQEGVSLEGATFDGVHFLVDFSELGYNTDYMVKYTDQHSPIFFSDVPGFILAGVPFLGPKFLEFIEYVPPVRSSTLCTDSVGSISGLGTSLIGDLYYGAGFLWIVVFMYSFGYTMSRLYHSDRNINKYHLLFYSYMVANAVYYVRSQWGFPIGTIIYSTIILFICDIVFKTKPKTSLIPS